MATDEIIILSDSDDDKKGFENDIFEKVPEVANHPQLIGMCKNPSGQMTLSFSSKLKRKRRPEQNMINDDHGRCSKEAKITSFFGDSAQQIPENRVSIAVDKSPEQTSVKVVLANKTNPSAEPSRIKKTARKMVKSFMPHPNVPLPGQIVDPDEVICISGSDEEDHAMKKAKFKVERSETKETSSSFTCFNGSVSEKMKKETVVKVEKSSSKACEQIIESIITDLKCFLPEHEFVKVMKKFRKRQVLCSSEHLNKKLILQFFADVQDKIMKERDVIYVHIKDALDKLEEVGRQTKQQEKPTSDAKSTLESTSEACTSASCSGSNTLKPLSQQIKPKASKRHILKLEKALKDCQRAIRQLEEAEVDLEDEDDSIYLKLSRYRKKCVQIYKKLADIHNDDVFLGRPQDKPFKFNGSRFPEINKKISKFVNRQRKKGQEYFPDYPEVLQLFKSHNDKLKLSQDIIREEAEKTFLSLGKKLKRYRIQDDFGCLQTYLPDNDGNNHTDPIEGNPELISKLEQSGQEGQKRLNEVLDDFAQRQASKREQNEGNLISVSENGEDNDGSESEEEANVEDEKEDLLCEKDETDNEKENSCDGEEENSESSEEE